MNLLTGIFWVQVVFATQEFFCHSAENSNLFEVLLAVGGKRLGQYFNVEILQYDPLTTHWSTVSYFPPALQSGQAAAAVPSNGRVYSCASYGYGGYWNRAPELAGTCLRYNATTQKWTPHHIARLPENFTSSNMVGLGDKIYALENPADTSPLLIYDSIKNFWTHAEDFPASNLDGVALAAGTDGKLYVAGGYQRVGGGGKHVASLYAYDPAQKVWTRLADMPTPRNELAIASFTHKSNNTHWLAAVGGRNAGADELATVEFYEVGANQWVGSKDWNLKAARRGTAAVATDDGWLYVVGGVSGERDMKSCEKLKLDKIFQPLEKLGGGKKEKFWEKFESMNNPRAYTTLLKVRV